MEPNSKILFNIGLIHAANGYHEEAVTNFNAATDLDNYLAIAYFQCGVSNFLLGRYQFAYKDFDVAFKHLRENQWMYVAVSPAPRGFLSHMKLNLASFPFFTLSDYEQLGLKFKLWSAEVLYNRGLCLIYMNQLDNGMRDLQAAKREKQVPDHDVIDDAIAAQGRQFTVFSLQEGVLFRPSADKVKNLKTKNYMGKAKLVAATEEKDAFTEFVGLKRKEQGLGPAGQLLAGQQQQYPTPDRKQSDPSPLPARSASPAGGLGRSRTVAERPSATAGRPSPGVRVQAPLGPGDIMDNGLSGRPRPQRSNTVGVVGPGARPAMNGMPTRGLSVRGRGDGSSDGSNGLRRLNTTGRDRSQPPAGREQQRPPPSRPASPPPEQRPPAPPSKGLAPPRMGDTAPLQVKRPSAKEENRGVMTQIYEDYLGFGGGNGAEDVPAQSQPQSQDPLSRVAAWQQRTVPGASPNVPPSRTPSQRRGGGGGSVLSGRRTPSKGNVIPGTRLSGSRGDDDDEGGSSVTDIVPFEQMKIRVKIHYDDDTRGMAVYPSASFDEFVEMLTIKFKKGWNNLNLKFMDTDGSKVSLRDEMDWDMAIEVARESVKGRGEAKLDMWMVDR
ncbi:hypothetical protein FRC00_003338 [Tulasnella sp. 408]|nr:hypothetical protein FRC00_003338 [Tulasnella sp. 408]